MQVLKFGGSSVADATNMSRVLDIVTDASLDDRVILVSSAISGCTDSLLQAAKGDKSLLEGLRDRHEAIIRRLFTGKERQKALDDCADTFRLIADCDSCVESYGEILSTNILAEKLACDGYSVRWIDSRKLIIKDDLPKSFDNIRKCIESCSERILVAPGFIASDKDGNVTTLGRGGSDYSAAIFAAATEASKLEIWTDVPGIMTANPKEVPQAETIPYLTYDAAWRLAEHGAKVLYPPTVEPAKQSGIGITVRNTFDRRNSGSLIKDKPSQSVWAGITRSGYTLCLVADHPFDKGETSSKIQAVLQRCCIDDPDIRFEEGCVLVRVPEGIEVEALKALHKEFFVLEESNVRNLYIAGKGAVGTALREMIEKTAASIKASSGKVLHIVEQVDSKSPDFCRNLVLKAPKNAVFVDVTDSEDIYKWYKPLLEAGVNIVSSNRRSLSVPYEEYAGMKKAALMGGAFLRYETTVGAALPILESIALSANSDDEITGIEAVVSCTLNYILSSGLPFGEALAKAQSIGLTEKDPSQDLEGRDALRKLLILAREAGVRLDEKDVEIEPVKNVGGISSNQRFVASLTRDTSNPLGYKASIRLQTVDEHHPAYWLRGTDNAIIVKSAYHPSPLVIQGAGEGARQAASSVLNDILK